MDHVRLGTAAGGVDLERLQGGEGGGGGGGAG